MRIVKVVIEGEFPERCLHCQKFFEWRDVKGTAEIYGAGLRIIEVEAYCHALDRSLGNKRGVLNDTYRYRDVLKRPTWCPLVKQEDGEE